jgi:hypothetical protein
MLGAPLGRSSDNGLASAPGGTSGMPPGARRSEQVCGVGRTLFKIFVRERILKWAGIILASATSCSLYRRDVIKRHPNKGVEQVAKAKSTRR